MNPMLSRRAALPSWPQDRSETINGLRLVSAVDLRKRRLEISEFGVDPEAGVSDVLGETFMSRVLENQLLPGKDNIARQATCSPACLTDREFDIPHRFLAKSLTHLREDLPLEFLLKHIEQRRLQHGDGQYAVLQLHRTGI